MRDLILTLFVFGSIPYIFKRPHFGLMMWIWLSIMNPHRLTWGFAYSMPFAQAIAIATLGSVLVNFNRLERFPLNGITLAMICFMFWIGVSPVFSFHPDYEFDFWLRTIKIQLMVLITLLIVGNREDLVKLVWVLTLSIGFFGVKGGLFTLASGGSYRVWGPSATFIEDNNHLALATIISVPLFRYLQMYADRLWLKRACAGAVLLSIVSALGSHSRGALLALLAMGFFLWLKSSKKAVIGVLVVAAVPLIFAAMPENWTERMRTITTYDQDASAMGRINAWWMAFNLAVDRFPLGGGFAIYEPDVFAKYAPVPDDIHAAHSIYFQVLGEHGFVGLFLFLSIFVLAWFQGEAIVRRTSGKQGLEWARDLAAMSQVSLIGYAVGGTFLSLSYFDLPYYVVVILVILDRIVKKQLAPPARTISPYVMRVADPPQGGPPPDPARPVKS